MSKSDRSPDLNKVADVAVLGDNEVSPQTLELTSGMRIRWTNRTNHACEISFASPSPFNGHTLVYDVPPDGVAISESIREDAPKASLTYVVKRKALEKASDEQTRGLHSPILNPTVIIRSPN
jgi:hypothetical protein